MEEKQIDFENITFEDLKEEYKILQVQHKALQTAFESNKESLDFWLKQNEHARKQVSELKGTLLSIAKLAQSELK